MQVGSKQISTQCEGCVLVRQETSVVDTDF